MLIRPTSNLATEGVHGRSGAFPEPPVLQVAATRHCSCCIIQVCYICPLLKKPGLDSADVKNYRPISNLKVISKLLERLAASQLMAYLSDNKLLPHHQSAYCTFCSTETVIARVLSDILTALDSGDIAILALLDLSAAFDTVIAPSHFSVISW